MPTRSVFFLGLDAHRELTLSQPLLRSLLDAGNRVGVAVRRPRERLLPLLDERLEAIVNDLDPGPGADSTFWARAAELQRRIAAFAPDLLVCASCDRTFLDQWLLRRSAAPTLGLASSRVPEQDLDALAPGAPRYGSPALDRSLSVPPEAHALDGNRTLLAAITGAGEAERRPRIQVPEREGERSRRALERLGLSERRYVLAAPAAAAAGPLEAWPPRSFLDLAGHLGRRHGLPVLLAGCESDPARLEGLVQAGADRGLHLLRWPGGPDDLGELLGLIRSSRLCLASEAGPLHFAAALDVPLLALLGGGDWPRFVPSARRSFVATRHLPCFGCGWECWLPEPACLTTVEAGVLLEGADWLLAGDAPDQRVDTGTPLPEAAQGMVRDGAALHRRTRSRIVTLEQGLRASELESARRQRTIAQQEQLIASLGAQVTHLSTAPAAFRVLTSRALKKLGLFALARRGRDSLRSRGGVRAESAAASGSGRRPLSEALALARSLPGDTPDAALERLYRLGQDLRSVLCLHTTSRNLQAVVMLAGGGSRVSWLGEASALGGLELPGLDAPAPDLPSLLVASERPTIPDGTALLLDAEGDEESLRCLELRLPPRTTLLVNGPTGRRWAQGLSPAATERVATLSVHASPPVSWREPAGSLPERLPSGRPWPRISVVTATRNQGRFLEQTLLSVLGQGYPDLEYIVRDGCSTDGTREILDRYRARLAHCVIESDAGQADALNKGFALATGQILAWLNSDDLYAPGALWRAAVAFDSFVADVVVGGCRLVGEDGNETVRVHHSSLPPGRVVPLPLDRILDLEGSWLKGDFFFQPEVFWTREIWQRSGGGVAKELFYSMDYDLWARMAREGARVVHVPDVLAVYRIHEDQKTAGVHLPYLPELRSVAEGLRRRWSLP